MRTLVKSLAGSLIFDEESARQELAPTVYTTAIRSDGDLVASLTGIAQLTRDLGFTLHPETLYGSGGCSATYHADHAERAVALAVDCNPSRGTVSLAVTGMDAEETLECFHALELALFGDC